MCDNEIKPCRRAEKWVKGARKGVPGKLGFEQRFESKETEPCRHLGRDCVFQTADCKPHPWRL